jgi:hypothetical protein
MEEDHQDSPQTRYMVVYCNKHNFGNLIDIETIGDKFDTEGNLRVLATYLQICPSGIFKKTPCSCELHGVINITHNMLTVEWIYGMPHERVYPKGWKLKYYIQQFNKKDKNYDTLKEYFCQKHN